MKAVTINKIIPLLGIILLPLAGFADDGAGHSASGFSNAMFNILLTAVILLLIVIVALSSALKNIAQSDYLLEKSREQALKKNETSSPGRTLGWIILLSLAGFSARAQTGQNWTVGGLDMKVFYFMITLIGIELIVIALLLNTIRSLLKWDKEEAPTVKPKENIILKKLTAAVAIEKEEEIMLSHNYDGIRELDNDLPPWWKYGFYLTIMVAFIYLIHYHVARTGDLQIAEYNKEVEKGRQEVAEFMKNAANNVDETNVKLMNGADLASGKELFISTCTACHGKLGEGGVGPNLTDPYWIHGGSLVDVFKTIKYGWPDKGMKSWKEDLSPLQIAQIANYVKTIVGTNPPNGKAPQGELYQEPSTPPDSTKISADTLTPIAIDSARKALTAEIK